MATERKDIEQALARRYEAGFVTQIEADTLAPGLSEDTIRFISAQERA